MTKHTYLRTTIHSDRGSAFVYQAIEELARALGINVKHATTGQAQTLRLLQRSHASMKQALKIERGERRSLWHK